MREVGFGGGGRWSWHRPGTLEMGKGQRERGQGGEWKRGVMVGDDLGMELFEMSEGFAGIEEGEDL